MWPPQFFLHSPSYLILKYALVIGKLTTLKRTQKFLTEVNGNSLTLFKRIHDVRMCNYENKYPVSRVNNVW